MKTDRPYARIIVTKKGARWLETGHPWVYGTDVSGAMGSGGEGIPFSGMAGAPFPEDRLPNGSVVDVCAENGKYYGSGFYSAKSRITVRILSRNANDRFDEAFWKRRVKYAVDYRRTVMGADFPACRLIFGEADGFPGLTVDLFRDLLSAEVLSYGMEQVKGLVYRLVVEELEAGGTPVRGLYERNEGGIRALEGLPAEKGWYPLPGKALPESPVTVIRENGISYYTDVENGQKTGFFLDQKYNRRAVRDIARGKHVLDCFTHTGSFALNAAAGGAASVTAVDISAGAIEMAERNAALNGLSGQVRFVKADVFDYLTELAAEGRHPYDLVILDPPAFTKSRKTAGQAERGYKEINMKAMRLLPRGGFLATASCSHFMPHERFLGMLREAARDAGVELRMAEARQQAKDHPVLLNVPETDYLKFYILQVV